MPTQIVNLTAELDAFVKTQVKSGNFNNSSEVHRAALVAMARDEEERTIRLERLKHEVQLGIDDLEAGRYRTVSSDQEHREFFSELKGNALAKKSDA